MGTRNRLSVETVRKAVAAGACRVLNDGGSLYLHVRGPGKAYWRHEYREPGTGEKRGVGFGCASEVTLKDARGARDKFDPANRPAVRLVGTAGMVRQTATAAPTMTFAAAVAQWLKRDGSNWSDKGAAARGRLAETLLGPMDVAAITSADVLNMLKAEKTARQRFDKLGWLIDAFAFATSQGMRIGDNPARIDPDTRKAAIGKIVTGNHQATVAWSELPALYAALPNDETGNAVRFQILTAARPGEVENATRGQIVDGVWTYTVRKGKKPHEHKVPLSTAAQKLIEKRTGKLFAVPSNAMLNLVKSLGFKDPETKEPTTPHGLRRTFRNWAAKQKLEDLDHGVAVRDLAELCLSHGLPGATSVETAYFDATGLVDERREFLEMYARFATGNGKRELRSAARAAGFAVPRPRINHATATQ